MINIPYRPLEKTKILVTTIGVYVMYDDDPECFDDIEDVLAHRCVIGNYFYINGKDILLSNDEYSNKN